MADFNEQIIDEFRTNDGVVTTYGFGSGLVLLHAVGSKTGQVRVTPVAARRDGDAWLVIASAAGAPWDPAWAGNLRAHPQIDIEAGTETLPVQVTELVGPSWQAARDGFDRHSSSFAQYQQKTDRPFPIFRLTRRT